MPTSTFQDVQEAIRRMPEQQLADFRAWFAEFDASAWDRQLESDVRTGKLDALADEAMRDLREGRCTDR